MGIGAGIFLIALGAILTFAVNWHVSGVDLHAVGWVLMIAGFAGIVLYFVFWNSRRRPSAVVARPPVAYVEQSPVYQRESVVYQDQNGLPPTQVPPSTPPGV